MASTEPIRKFNPLSQFFHWVIAALLLFQVPLAYYMINQPLSPDKLGNYALHKSIGITIFTLAALRLAWRWLRPAPPLPRSMAPWERTAARVTHGLLYFLLFAMPITGWFSSSAANFPVSVFKLFTLPNLVPEDETLHERLELAHELLAYTLFATFAAHLLAALYHHFRRRDNVLLSMLPFARLR